MKKSSDKPWNGCPVRYAAGILGDKWTLLILRDLLFKERRYFSDFMDDDETIATNILSDRLARLCDNGIVLKSRDVNDGKKYVYTLTEKGTDLIPMFTNMIIWSAKHDEQTQVGEEQVVNISKSKEGFRKRVLRQIKKLDQGILSRRP